MVLNFSSPKSLCPKLSIQRSCATTMLPNFQVNFWSDWPQTYVLLSVPSRFSEKSLDVFLRAFRIMGLFWPQNWATANGGVTTGG